MDAEPTSGRSGRLAVATALVAGVAMVGAGLGGLVGVDRKLQAATPAREMRNVSDHPLRHRPCPAPHGQHRRAAGAQADRL